MVMLGEILPRMSKNEDNIRTPIVSLVLHKECIIYEICRMTTRDQIEENDTLMVLLALPGQLFLRLLSALALPLILPKVLLYFLSISFVQLILNLLFLHPPIPKLVAALGSMDADTGGKVLAKVLAFYAILNLAIECTGLAIFLAIDPGANVNLDTQVFNQTQQSETLPLR